MPGTYVGARLARLKGGGVPSFYLGQQWFSNQSTGTAASAYTYHQTFAVETAGKRIRFSLLNTNTSPMTVPASCAAVSNRAGTTTALRITPSTGIWVPITWNGGATSITVPAGSAGLPYRVVSDWIDLPTIPRTDGGSLPIYLARFALPTGPFSICGYGMSPWNATSGINNGRILATYRDVGDFASGNQGGQTGTVYSNPFLAGYEIDTATKTFNFFINGDSIDEGVVNTGGGANFGNGMWWQSISALRAANPALAIGYINNAFGGTTTSTFRGRIDRFVASGLNYDALCYSAFSPNDGTPTQARTDLMKTRLDAILSDFSGKAILLRTPAPNTAAAYDATADGYRLGMRSYILGRAAGLVRAGDIEGGLSDGATPARYATGKSDDGTHPNEVGDAACVTTLQPQLQAMLPA